MRLKKAHLLHYGPLSWSWLHTSFYQVKRTRGERKVIKNKIRFKYSFNFVQTNFFTDNRNKIKISK